MHPPVFGVYPTLPGFPTHGGDNQQVSACSVLLPAILINWVLKWELTPLGLGFSIRSLSSGQYLTIEAGIYNGVPIVASPYPVSWAVQMDVHNQDTVQ